MKKILIIAWKDLLMSFRDPSALLMMLVTPFALTLAIGFAFGGIGRKSSETGLSNIPLIIVNHDSGQFGAQLVRVFQSKEFDSLLAPAISTSDQAARLAVDQDRAAAAVIIPANFSESILPSSLLSGLQSGNPGGAPPKSVIEIYNNPTRSVSTGVIRGVVDSYLASLISGSTGGQVTITQMLSHGILTPEQAQQQGQSIGEQAGQKAAATSLIELNTIDSSGQTRAGFDWLTYMAPSMAIIFLMFTVTSGGRSILSERQAGTLPRLLITPSTPAQVLGGKATGIYITGLAQMLILFTAGALLFNIHWGDPAALVLLTLALVWAATGWGMLIAAYSRTPGQAGMLGSMLTLVFAAAAGNFIPRSTLPGWLQTISYVSPNAWGLEGYTRLSQGGVFNDISVYIAGLVVLGGVLFMLASFLFYRQYKGSGV